MDEIEKSLKDLKLAEEQLKALKQAFKGLSGAELKAALSMFKTLLKDGRGFEDAVRKTVEATKDLNKSFYSTQETVKDLYGQLRGITEEIKGQQGPLKKSRGAFRALESAAQQLLLDEASILDLNKHQAATLLRKLKSNQEIVKQEAQRLLTGENLSKEANQELKSLLKQISLSGELGTLKGVELEKALELVKNAKHLTEEEKAILSSQLAQDSVIDNLVEKGQARLDLERTINKNIGVTGALVEGVGGIMQRLGMRSGIFQQAMQDSAEEMREMAKAAGDNANIFDRLNIAASGLSTLLKGFVPALLDPLVIVGSILNGFFELNKATVEFQNLTGQSATAVAGLNNRLASSVDYLEQAAALTKLTGFNANNIFSKRTIATAAELQNTMGLTADEAGKLGIISDTNTGYLDDQIEAIVDTTSAFNKANRSAISQGQILRDVANTSDSIKLSLGNNPGLIAAAASAARRLGMELSDVDRIADSLMNFESSIQNELEAQLLTGRQINLGKARELALNNDLVGLGNELFKNSVDIAEYGNMNRIQQESMAKALGMSKDELGRIAYLRAMENGLTAEAAAEAAKVSAEDMKRMSVQEQMQKSIQKLAQAAAPVLEVIAGVVDVLTPFLTTAAKGIAFLVRGFAGIGESLSAMGKGLRPIINAFVDDIEPTAERAMMYLVAGYNKLGNIGDYVRDKFTGIKDLIVGFGSKFKILFNGIRNQFRPIFDYVESKVNLIKEKFNSIAESFKSSALGKAAVSISKLFGSVDKGEKSLAGIGSILGDLGKIAGVGIIASKVYKGIKSRRAPKGTSSDPINVVMAGSGMMGDILGGKGKKGGIIDKIFGKKFKGGQFMGKGLRAPAGGARAGGMLSKAGGLLKGVGPKLLKGSGVLAAVGAVTDLVGNVSKAAKNPEKGVGDAIGRTLDQNKFMALGAAIGSVVPGVGTLIGAGIGGLVDFASSQVLGEKGMITDSLEAPPKLAAGGIVTQATTAVVGEAGPEAVIPLREFYAKMDELITVVKQGGDVYIDGNKAGQSLMLASTKLS